MKCVIWGLGVRGKRIASKLHKDDVVAFIDSNKAGEFYQGEKIIRFSEYLEKYSEYFVLITPLNAEGIKKELEEAGISWFWNLEDCPSELQTSVLDKGFEEYLKTYDKKKTYGIYGTTFYSIYLYELLYKNGCEGLYLLPEENADRSRLQKILQTFDFIRTIPDQSWGKYIDELYITIDIREREAGLKKESGYVTKNMFDFTHVLPQYRNPALRKFKNRNEGERCFIVATGPSLRMEDLDKLRLQGERSISLNRIYLAFEQTKWRPDYYVVSDKNCIEESGEEIKRLPVEYKFVSDSYPPFWKNSVPDNIYKYHSHYSYVSSGALAAYAEDIEYGIYNSGTVTYDAIQLAVYLGFKEIYLLGVDFQIAGDYRQESNHFAKNYYTKDSRVGVFAKEQQLRGYQAAKQYADTHGIKIYNATRGGKLEVFERVDFDKVIEHS